MSLPPSYNPLSQRKRQSLSLLSSNPKRRKPSTGPSLLRQASFPPSSPTGPNVQYSRSVSPADSVAVVSAVSGMTGITTGTTATMNTTAPPTTTTSSSRKKSKKKKRPADDGDSQVTMGGRRAGQADGAAGNDEDEPEEDDQDEGGDVAVAETEKTDELVRKQEREQLNMLIEAFDADQGDRYLVWRRVRLKKDTLRKIINHTLSQSVPPSVITTVNGYTKIFIGELIEKARQVQLEWLAAAVEYPNGDPIPADTPIEERTKAAHRGPLTADHLREAARRCRRAPLGAGTGFTGMSLVGRESARARLGGRRVFR